MWKVTSGKPYHVEGQTLGYGNGGQIFLLKYDKSLNLVWQQLWGGPSKDAVQSLVISGSFVYLVGSTENNSAGLNDALLIKTKVSTREFPSP